MADLAGYTFNYDAGTPQQPTQLLGWQICLAHPETQSLEDADNYADYAVNRDKIVQMLGIGMSRGQNAYDLDGQLFVVLVAEQRDGSPEPHPIDQAHPLYAPAAAAIAEELLRGNDHGMLAFFPNGHVVPFTSPTEAQAL